jgi:PAS domain S-box-containing protein
MVSKISSLSFRHPVMTQLFRNLIAPSPALTSLEKRAQARLVSVTALSFPPVLLLLTPFIRPQNASLWILLFLFGASCTAYLLSRTKWFTLGSWLLVISSFAAVYMVMGAFQLPYLQVFFIIPIFLLSLFSSTLITAGMALGIIAIVAALHYGAAMPVEEYRLTQVFLSIVSIFIVVSSGMRHHVHRTLLRRSEELAARESWYRGVVDGSLDSFYLLESVRDARGEITDFRFVDVNERGAAMISMQRSQIIGQLLCELLPINRTDGYFDRYVQVVKTGQALEEEFPIRDANFKANWLHHQVVPVNGGIAITTRDITERKNAELKVRENEARLRALVNAIPDLMFVFDENGVFLDYHAPSPEELYFAPEQFLNKSMRELYPPELSEPMMNALEELRAAPGIQVVEYQLPLNGTIQDFEARLIASGDNRFLAIVRDVTEHKQLNQQKLALEVERERMQVLTSFIRMASHEFRTPLAIINSSTYLMARNEDGEQRQERARRIEEQVLNLSRLVENLVLMTKLDSGFQSTMRRSDVIPLIEQLAAKAELLAKKQNQVLHCSLPPQPLTLCVDTSSLSIAIMNILENAVNFTPADGEIRLSLSQRENQALIRISDNGIGIAPEVHERIFERFYRVDKAQTMHGFGLGLSIAKRIVELHGGTIQVESQPGKGSTFTISLPVQQDMPRHDTGFRVTQTIHIPISLP